MPELAHTNGRRLSPGWIVIISVLATSGFWNIAHQILINDKPSREEVKQLMRENSPYMQDRAMILFKLDEMNKKLDEVRGEMAADRKLRR